MLFAGDIILVDFLKLGLTINWNYARVHWKLIIFGKVGPSQNPHNAILVNLEIEIKVERKLSTMKFLRAIVFGIYDLIIRKKRKIEEDVIHKYSYNIIVTFVEKCS